MVTSLAAQLARGASLNAPILSESSRKKHAAASYLFSSAKASDDLDALHALARNALTQLKVIDESFGQVEERLFSEHARETDRTLLGIKETEELDAEIDLCLKLLGPWLLEDLAGRVLEWLVKRFRIHEFNVDSVLTLFLPYHESPHFAKMVSILHVEERNPWSFLVPYKSAGKPLSRTTLATEMLKNSEVARAVGSLLPSALGGVGLHRTLLLFNTSALLEYITRAESAQLNAGTLAFLIPALLEPLKELRTDIKPALRKDGVLGSFVLLSALSQKCRLAPDAVKGIVGAMIRAASRSSSLGIHLDGHQLLTALVSVMGAQELLHELPITDVDAFVQLRHIANAIRASFTWSGTQKVLLPMLDRIIEQATDVKAAAVLECIVTADRVPADLTTELTRRLIRARHAKPEKREQFEALLSNVYRRHSNALQSAAEQLANEKQMQRDTIDEILLGITSGLNAEDSSGDAIVAATSAEPAVRAAAVREIAQRLQDETDAESVGTFQEALKARIEDTSVDVLVALYANPAPLLPLIDAALMSTLGTSLLTQDTPRNILRTQARFFASAVYSAKPDLGTHILTELLFPFVLFTRPKHRSAVAVWEAVQGTPLAGHSLLRGVFDIVGPLTEKSASPSAEDMARVNSGLIAKLAENVRASDDFARVVDSLVAGLSAQHAPRRVLSFLLLQSLVEVLSGEHQVDVACRAVEAVERLGEFSRLAESAKEVDATDLTKEMASNVVVKPGGRVTALHLHLSLLIVTTIIRRPSNVGLDWLSHNASSGSDVRGALFIRLLRTTYRVVNSTVTLWGAIALHLNSKIFEQLGADALLFLAGVWTTPKTREGAIEGIALVALRHALAFMRAQPQDSSADFQVVLPSLLCALQASDRRIRGAAGECIEALFTLASAAKPSSVYAYDQVYGAASGSVQYLDWADEKRYLEVLADHREHLLNDAEYLTLVHHESLAPIKSTSKKDTKYRQRVLCFLLSHALCTMTIAVKVAILKSLQRVPSVFKAQMLLPVIESALASTEKAADAETEEFMQLALASLDVTTAKEMNDEGSKYWKVLLQALRHYHGEGETLEQWKILTTQLKAGLFSVLASQHQIELLLTLLDLTSAVGDVTFGTKALIEESIRSPTLILALLKELQPKAQQGTERAKKRAKVDAQPSEPASKNELGSLIVLAEILSAQKLPGSLELISSLLDTLGRVASAEIQAQSDARYLEQLLMAAVDSAASQIKELPNLSPSAIRVDVLVDLLRTNNPQTFHQALLLMASLARLSPESVLHNVMPIFTFMGSNIFHRDDSYSFKVIQKTTDSIVPVVSKSLKEKHSNALDLYIDAREFLRTFTDASTHVPRHRRTNFFTHLIDVLGPGDFLAPVCMLLVDKMSNRVPRQDPEEAQTSLSLPLTLLKHYQPSEQISTIQEVLSEAQRLRALVADESIDVRAYLEPPLDEPAVSPSVTRKRQCIALLIFVGHGIKGVRSRQETSSKMLEVVQTLLDIATTEDEETARDADITTAARWALLRALQSISASEFANVMLTMLKSGDTKIQHGALDLLAERLSKVSPSARDAVSATLAEAVDIIRGIISGARDAATVLDSAMASLRSIAETARGAEEAALTNTVPAVLDVLRTRPELVGTARTLVAMIIKLGPRVIPHMRQIVDVCVATMLDAGREGGTEVLSESFKVLTSLLRTIPTFWGTRELKAVCNLLLSAEFSGGTGAAAGGAESLAKDLAKRAPSRTLLATLCEIWPSLDEVRGVRANAKLTRFFDLLRRCLHSAPRKDVLESLRALFDRFLQSFGLRSVLGGENTIALEDKVISAFLELVVKLNESAFRPLFRRLYDWAFGDSKELDKKTAFFRIYTALLDLFKELMSPYMSIVINGFKDLLESFHRSEVQEKVLWSSCMETLQTSFLVDEGVFWRDDRIRSISTALTQQIATAISLKLGTDKAVLSTCLAAMLEYSDNDSLLKSVNLAILMHTRSDDTRVRLFALSCAVEVWRKHAKKLVGFGPETATFILECADDDNDDIVRECHKLKEAVERESGKIEGL